MKPTLILIGLLVAAGILLYLHELRFRRAHPSEPEDKITDETETDSDGCSAACCAANEVCPSQILLENELKKEVTYYDDYELDAFSGRSAADYSEDEIEIFRNILYTLLPSDFLGWERSLKKRGIIMPGAIHDEFIDLYNSTQ